MTLILALCVFSCTDSKNEAEASKDETALQPVQGTESSKKLEIDAASRTDWVGFDLDTGRSIGVAELPANGSWDLAFKRTSIKMHGAEVKMQVVAKDFATIDVAPKDGYVSDQPSTDPAAVETSGLAFHNDPAWYVYDINTHVISSRNLVYVIKTNEGRYFKFMFLDYYNAARLPAYINFEFQELKGAEP